MTNTVRSVLLEATAALVSLLKNALLVSFAPSQSSTLDQTLQALSALKVTTVQRVTPWLFHAHLRPRASLLRLDKLLIALLVSQVTSASTVRETLLNAQLVITVHQRLMTRSTRVSCTHVKPVPTTPGPRRSTNTTAKTATWDTTVTPLVSPTSLAVTAHQAITAPLEQLSHFHAQLVPTRSSGARLRRTLVKAAHSASTAQKVLPCHSTVRMVCTVHSEVLPSSLALEVSTVMRRPDTKRLLAQSTHTALVVPHNHSSALRDTSVQVVLKLPNTVRTVDSSTQDHPPSEVSIFASRAHAVPTQFRLSVIVSHAQRATSATVAPTLTNQCPSNTTRVRSVQRALTAQLAHLIQFFVTQVHTILNSVARILLLARFALRELRTQITAKRVAPHAVSLLVPWKAQSSVAASVPTEFILQLITHADAVLASISKTLMVSVRVTQVTLLTVSSVCSIVVMVPVKFVHQTVIASNLPTAHLSVTEVKVQEIKFSVSVLAKTLQLLIRIATRLAVRKHLPLDSVVTLYLNSR